jgi:hypothetical protein
MAFDTRKKMWIVVAKREVLREMALRPCGLPLKPLLSTPNWITLGFLAFSKLFHHVGQFVSLKRSSSFLQ